MEQQLQLFEKSQNPLEERLGKCFFDELPKKPGVYLMYGRSGRLLYVGKAKNLRNRVFTYRRVTSKHRSRKTKRLVWMTHRIELCICKNEEAALLKENNLIRKHRPEFNRAKKSPETYYFLSLVPVPDQQHWAFQLGMHQPEESLYSGHIYGAFKGHRTVRSGAGALLRLLYTVEYDVQTPFDYPGTLTQKLTPLKHTLKAKQCVTLSDQFISAVASYLSGSSINLFELLVNILTDRDLLNQPAGRLILRDMELLRRFYEYCTKRNHKLIDLLSLPQKPIPQHKLDDYLIQAAFRE